MPETQSMPPWWADSKIFRAWLEQRYSLGNASLGSPLYQYMQEIYESQSDNAGMSFVALGEMLSWKELMRWAREHGLAIAYSHTREKLYPNFGDPADIPRPLDPASLSSGRKANRIWDSTEPKWNDVKGSRTWLEKYHPIGPLALGSPLLRYMKACHASGNSDNSPTTYLGSMLTDSEWKRFLSDCPDSARHRQPCHPDNILYPEYGERQWLDFNPALQDPDLAQLSTTAWPRIEPLPPPSVKPLLFTESYPPYLQRHSSSSSVSGKRKGHDGDDASLEHPADKRRRQPSDLSGGVMVSAKPPTSIEGHDILRHQNYFGSMPPPPRPQNTAVTRTPPRQTYRSADEREFSKGLELNLLLTPVQFSGPARQYYRSMETPKNGGTVQRDLPRKRNIREVEDGLLASSAFKKKRAPPDNSSENLLVSNPPEKTPMADFSKQSSNEHVEDASLESSPSEIRRTPSNSGGDESPRSSSSTETPLAVASTKRSIDDVEDAMSTTSTPKRKRTLPESDSYEMPSSSPFDPPERSDSFPLLQLDETPSENGTKDASPHPTPLSREAPSYEHPTMPIFKSNNTEIPALRSGSQSTSIDGVKTQEETSVDDPPAAHLGDHDVGLIGGTETLERCSVSPVTSEPESQDERNIKVEEDPDDTIIGSEHLRDHTTTPVTQNLSDRQEQNARSVVPPLQMPQREPAQNQMLSSDEGTINIPVIRNKRKGGRKPTTKGRKAPRPEPHREQAQRKPRKKVQKGGKSRPLKPDPQTYVRRLRSGVGDRTHKKLELVALEFKGRKAVQVRAN